jgi:hypothetical protein
MAQSLFEGAMYTFVFMWTPALKSDAEKVGNKSNCTHPEDQSVTVTVKTWLFP